jgi:sugar phosphate isomerase/epimerase
MDCYKKYLELAELIEAEVMVVHAGYINKDAVKIQQIKEIAELNLIENLQNLGDYASGRNVIIGLENSPPTRHQLMVWEPRKHIDILEKINHPQVKAVYDIAHAFLHGYDIYDYYKKIEPYLAEMHIHNNDGKQDQHRSISDGAIDYEHFFSTHQVSVPVIMEIRNIEEALHSLEWIKDFNE